ncbi:increased DNA methylation 1 [Lactuca sativa]|nr:increased DNA methylation 1 [Lactuca sativa]
MCKKSRNNSIPEKSPSVGDPTENRKRKHDSTEPLNQTQVQKRPKRDVRLPSSLHDFYVEPSLKLTRKRKPRKIRTSGVCKMNASGNTPETHSDEISAFTPIPESELRKVLSALRKARGDKNVKIKKEPDMDMEMEMEKDSGDRLGEKSSNVIGYNYIDTTGDNFNEDICDICGGDDGQLICCDGCPATFHLSCLQIQTLPSDRWYCMYCSCKFCGGVVFDWQSCIPHWILSCCLCDDKFHKTCGETNVAKIDYGDLFLCGKTCHEIYARLQAMLGVKIGIGEGFSLTLLKRSEDRETDIKKIKCSSYKLAVALSVMNECFHPVVDIRSGVDIIRNVVYNCG